MKKKCIIVLLIQLILIITISHSTYAISDYNKETYIETLKIATDEAPVKNPLENPGSFKPSDMEDAGKVKNIGNKIIGAVQFIGTFASVIVLIVMGIKYMLGSVEEKAEYKKTMMPYIVGAILVFGITNILGIISTIAEGLF